MFIAVSNSIAQVMFIVVPISFRLVKKEDGPPGLDSQPRLPRRIFQTQAYQKKLSGLLDGADWSGGDAAPLHYGAASPQTCTAFRARLRRSPLPSTLYVPLSSLHAYATYLACLLKDGGRGWWGRGEVDAKKLTL